jgi:hypothetical protein
MHPRRRVTLSLLGGDMRLDGVGLQWYHLKVLSIPQKHNWWLPSGVVHLHASLLHEGVVPKSFDSIQIYSTAKNHIGLPRMSVA